MLNAEQVQPVNGKRLSAKGGNELLFLLCKRMRQMKGSELETNKDITITMATLGNSLKLYFITIIS